MNLRYTKKAAEGLAEILDYIALQSPVGGRSVSVRIRDMINLLLDFQPPAN